MVFSECYALPVFLEESSELIEKNMVKGATSMWREKIFHEDFSPKLELDVPFKGMKQLTDILYSMESDAKLVLNRFRNISPSDKAKVLAKRYPYIFWQKTDELTDLKLQYIDSYLNKVQDVCQKVSSDPAKATEILKSEIESHRDGMKLRNLKSNVVKTTIPYYMSAKDMLDFQRGYKLTITEESIQYEVLDFLMEFYNVRLKSNIKDMYKEASFKAVSKLIESALTKALSRSEMLHDATIATVTKDISGLVELFFYTVNMNLLQLAQYVIAIYMRVLSAYVSNMRSIMKLISVLDIQSGDVDSVISECVEEIMDTCTLANPADIINATDNLLTALTNMNIVTEKEMRETAGIATDEMSYKFPIIHLKTLDERLRKLILLCRDDKESSISDLLSDTELSGSNLNEIFCQTERAENVNFLKSVSFHPGCVYRDLEFMKNYIPRISEGLERMSNGVIVAYIHALETNVNNVFQNAERNAETIDFLRDLLGKVSDYGRDLAQAYVRRLKIIGEHFHTDTDEIDINLEPDTYFGDPVTSAYNVITEYSEAVEEVNQKYRKLYISTSIGADFFEDDNNDQNKNNQQNDQQKDQSKDNNTSNGNTGVDNKDKKNPEKPTVQDPGPANSNSNGSSNSSSDNNNGNDEKKDKKSIVQRLTDFINKTIDNISDYFEKKGAKKKNLDFLHLHEKFLKGRNYVNTRINMLPYLKNSDYTKKAEDILNTIANIDENTLKTADEKTLLNHVFSKFKLPEGDDPLDVKLTQVFKIGSAKPVTVTLENNALKAEIPGMLDFVDDYYNHFIDKLQNLKKGVEKLGDLDQKSGSGENDRTEANKSLLASCANSVITAARSAARDRVNDIMLIISALSKSDPVNKGDNNDNNKNESNNSSGDSNGNDDNK